MSAAMGTRTCGRIDCHRTVMTTAKGRADGPIRYAFCEAHTAFYMTGAFGSGQSAGGMSVPPATRALPGVVHGIGGQPGL